MIEAHLTAPLTLAELAQECNLSRSYFMRAFKRSTGTSPYRWLLDRRIDRAKQLLRESECRSR
jgi:AraC family transcriptional regulator